MPSSNDLRLRGLLGLLLILANAMMFASWPWLRSMRFTSNTADPFFRFVNGQPRMQSPAILRNPAYLKWFFDTIRRQRGIFVLGTSESCVRFHLAAQLNHLAPEQPQMAIVATGGGSSIHSCVAFARCQTEGITIPPTVILLNLVYYMQSHDVINDGWLGNIVPSPLFVFMNNGNVRQAMSADVKALYDRHFRSLWPLYPFWLQQYEGNLLYLLSHQDPPDSPRPPCLPWETYAFSGVRPEYDEERAVTVGYVAADQMAKHRWLVNSIEDTVNIKGLASTMNVLDEQPAPTLLVILPMNRTFYQYNGMDMAAFDSTYRQIRERIRSFARDGHVFVADLYDEPKLDAGFMDRMHQDAYGVYQLARYLIAKSPDYTAFIEATRNYYAEKAHR
jgi:hypothetical protein